MNSVYCVWKKNLVNKLNLLFKTILNFSNFFFNYENYFKIFFNLIIVEHLFKTKLCFFVAKYFMFNFKLLY